MREKKPNTHILWHKKCLPGDTYDRVTCKHAPTGFGYKVSTSSECSCSSMQRSSVQLFPSWRYVASGCQTERALGLIDIYPDASAERRCSLALGEEKPNTRDTGSCLLGDTWVMCKPTYGFLVMRLRHLAFIKHNNRPYSYSTVVLTRCCKLMSNRAFIEVCLYKLGHIHKATL